VAKVLLIDGPLRGQVREYEHWKPLIHEGIEYEWKDDILATVCTQVVTRYTARPLVVFGRLMWFGTMEDELPYDAVNDAFWDLCATGLAQEFAEPEPKGPPRSGA
jgi:hypothetical protein